MSNWQPLPDLPKDPNDSPFNKRSDIKDSKGIPPHFSNLPTAKGKPTPAPKSSPKK